MRSQPPNRDQSRSADDSDGRAGAQRTTRTDGRHGYGANVCGKCGARRIDRQIGLEESPDEWVARLVEVFREVRRVLRDDGTLWVEIGDSYARERAGATRLSSQDRARSRAQRTIRGRSGWRTASTVPASTSPKTSSASPGSSPSPSAQTAGTCAPRSSGRGPNPMPESVTDRPTKAHSTVFLLSKIAEVLLRPGGDPGAACDTGTSALDTKAQRAVSTAQTEANDSALGA